MKTESPVFFRRASLSFVLVVAAATMVSSCSIIPAPVADPTRYYVLASPVPPLTEKTPRPEARLIGLRGVELPGYLRGHRDVVVRSGTNEVDFQGYARWAEPLEAGVGRVVRDRLLTLDGIAGVAVPPFSVDARRDFDVHVRVLQCEGLSGSGKSGVARFSASYEIVAAGGGGETLVRRTFTAPDADWDGNNFAVLARLLSEAIAGLAEDIAANLPK